MQTINMCYSVSNIVIIATALTSLAVLITLIRQILSDCRNSKKDKVNRTLELVEKYIFKQSYQYKTTAKKVYDGYDNKQNTLDIYKTLNKHEKTEIVEYLNSFEFIALQNKSNLIDIDLLKKMSGSSLKRTYKVFKPIISDMRTDFSPKVYIEFSSLMDEIDRLP